MSKKPVHDPDRDFVVSAALASTERVALTQWPVAGDIMLAAGPLRTLLIYDTLSASANTHGVEILIPPAPTDFIRSASPVSNVVFANGGECVIWGTKVHGFIFCKGHVNFQQSQLRDLRGMDLSEFLKDPVLIVGGIRITRCQLIHYVANKMGASHYDRKRGKHNDENIDRARASFFFELDPPSINQHFDRKLVLRESGSFSAFPQRIDCVLLQIFTTCQLLVGAPQVVRLRSVLDGRPTESYPTLPSPPSYPIEWPTKLSL